MTTDVSEKTHKHIAVLLATYNGANYLSEFLDSLVTQTCQSFRLFVRDDGSTDETLKIVQSYGHKLDILIVDTNVRLGPAGSFFELLDFAGGDFDYYFFADQDDYWYANKIERAMEILAPGKETVSMYCSRQEYVDAKLKYIGMSRVPRIIALENALVENIATGCTVAVTNSARSLVLGSKPSRVVMHDWWTYIVCVTFGHVFFDSITTIKYRQHGKNTLGAATTIWQEISSRAKRFIRREGGVFGLSQQAAEFAKCFGDQLQADQAALVASITKGKIRFSTRLRLTFFSRFVRQRWLDTIVLRLLFLLNRF